MLKSVVSATNAVSKFFENTVDLSKIIYRRNPDAIFCEIDSEPFLGPTAPVINSISRPCMYSSNFLLLLYRDKHFTTYTFGISTTEKFEKKFLFSTQREFMREDNREYSDRKHTFQHLLKKIQNTKFNIKNSVCTVQH